MKEHLTVKVATEILRKQMHIRVSAAHRSEGIALWQGPIPRSIEGRERFENYNLRLPIRALLQELIRFACEDSPGMCS